MGQYNEYFTSDSWTDVASRPTRSNGYWRLEPEFVELLYASGTPPSHEPFFSSTVLEEIRDEAAYGKDLFMFTVRDTKTDRFKLIVRKRKNEKN